MKIKNLITQEHGVNLFNGWKACCFCFCFMKLNYIAFISVEIINSLSTFITQCSFFISPFFLMFVVYVVV